MNFLKKISSASWIAVLDVLVLLVGLGLYELGYGSLQKTVFMVALIILALPLWFGIIDDIFHQKFGVDLIAGLAIVGAWLLGQSVAGLVVVLMLSGGQTLESFAMNQAKRELTRLLARAPQTALKKVGERYEKISIDQVIPGDEIMIKSGEIIPVDGTIISGISLVDESSITGESIPVEKIVGSLVVSGTENTSGVLVIRAEKKASESRYAKIVTLVKNAQESRAPLVRLADQYAVFFTGITLGIGFLSYVIFQDPVRVLAVLVVATPCPLILATPIAIISGMSRSAKRGVIIKQGGALEILARVKTMMFDKTGTITVGVPSVVGITTFAPDYDVLQIAVSLDHGSSHILARSLEHHAKTKTIQLVPVEKFQEVFGDGVFGVINQQEFFLGKFEYLEKTQQIIADEVRTFYTHEKDAGHMMVFLASKEHIVGAISFADTVRDDAVGMFRALTNHGVTTVMVTGDHAPVAQSIAQSVGITTVHADCTPEEKVNLVDEMVKNHGPVAMVGDGINDAPALARADVGIAIAHHGDTATSDAADMVVLHGSIERVVETYQIAQKTVSIAKQGMIIGIGLSIIAMIVAMFGLIAPLPGAILQEGIDIIVILGALRVLFVKI